MINKVLHGVLVFKTNYFEVLGKITYDSNWLNVSYLLSLKIFTRNYTQHLKSKIWKEGKT